MSDTDQQWNASQYAQNARFVSDLGAPVVELLAPKPAEDILDLGCGDGALTTTLMELGCNVVAIDASDDMVAAARELGIEAAVADAHELQFSECFDAVFSNAALHWMTRPAEVIDGVWRALRPGGRFVAEFGGARNVAAIVAELDAALSRRDRVVSNPWFFPDVATYSELLTSNGFRINTIELFPRFTPLPGDISAWLETFAQHYTAVLAPEARSDFVAEVMQGLRPVLCDDNGTWHVDYVRLRFSATKVT